MDLPVGDSCCNVKGLAMCRGKDRKTRTKETTASPAKSRLYICPNPSIRDLEIQMRRVGHSLEIVNDYSRRFQYHCLHSPAIPCSQVNELDPAAQIRRASWAREMEKHCEEAAILAGCSEKYDIRIPEGIRNGVLTTTWSMSRGVESIFQTSASR